MDSDFIKKIRQDLQDVQDNFCSGFRMKPEAYNPLRGMRLRPLAYHLTYQHKT